MATNDQKTMPGVNDSVASGNDTVLAMLCTLEDNFVFAVVAHDNENHQFHQFTKATEHWTDLPAVVVDATGPNQFPLSCTAVFHFMMISQSLHK